MTPGTGPAFEQAMDQLLLKVDYDNVLDVHRAFRKHADELLSYLTELDAKTTLGLCGLDPVSREIRKPESMGGKIRELLEVHRRHGLELDAVASRLLDVAREYGRTEDEIQRELRGK